MPADRHGGDAEDRCNRLNVHAFEFVHDDDGAPTWMEHVQCPPDSAFRIKSRFDVGVRGGHHRGGVKSLPGGRLTPLVLPDVDQYANEPGFFSSPADRYRMDGFGRT